MATDIVLAAMRKNNVPLTRENYLYIAYMGDVPEEIGGEIEASIPQEVKDADDIAWMNELGVQWTPEHEEL